MRVRVADRELQLTGIVAQGTGAARQYFIGATDAEGALVRLSAADFGNGFAVREVGSRYYAAPDATPWLLANAVRVQQADGTTRVFAIAVQDAMSVAYIDENGMRQDVRIEGAADRGVRPARLNGLQPYAVVGSRAVPANGWEAPGLCVFNALTAYARSIGHGGAVVGDRALPMRGDGSVDALERLRTFVGSPQLHRGTLTDLEAWLRSQPEGTHAIVVVRNRRGNGHALMARVAADGRFELWNTAVGASSQTRRPGPNGDVLTAESRARPMSTDDFTREFTMDAWMRLPFAGEAALASPPPPPVVVPQPIAPMVASVATAYSALGVRARDHSARPAPGTRPTTRGRAPEVDAQAFDARMQALGVQARVAEFLPRLSALPETMRTLALDSLYSAQDAVEVNAVIEQTVAML